MGPKRRRRATEGQLGGGIDLGGGNGINAIAVLGESQVAESHEIASDLLETVTLVLKVMKDVHLENILGSGQLTVWDRLSQTIQLGKHSRQELS